MLIGATSIGLTDHVGGVLRGLIQARERLLRHMDLAMQRGGG
jgi:hypothetical protein